MSQAASSGQRTRYVVYGLVLAGLAAVLFPVTIRRPERYPPRSCQSQLKVIGLAFAEYCRDYDERMPPARVWHGPSGCLHPYLKNPELWSCPQGPSDRPHYGYNNTRDGVAGVICRDIAEPATTIMCLDYDATIVGRWVPHRTDLAQPDVARHREGVNCVFQDGHVKWLAAGKAAEGHYWTRQADTPPLHVE